jgi:hypothetical protein
MARNLNPAQANFKGKVVRHQRITGEEFSDLLDAANLSHIDFAYLWGTDPRKVLGWIEGTDYVPFPIAWCLPLLQKSANLELARQIVEPRAPVKPEFVERDVLEKQVDALRLSVAQHLASLKPEIEAAESKGEKHRSAEPARRFEILQNARGMMNISRQIDELRAISYLLDMGIDVNQEIEKANAPFIEKITADRRARSAKQRNAAPDLPAYRGGRRK